MAKLVAIHFLLFTLVNICSSSAPFHINPTASQLAEPLSLRHVQILKVIHEIFIECFDKQKKWDSVNRGQTNVFLLNVEPDVSGVTELDNYLTSKPPIAKVKIPNSLKSPDKLATLMKRSLSRLENGLISAELADCIHSLTIEPGQEPNMAPVLSFMDKLKANGKSGQVWWSAMDKTMKIIKYVLDQFPNTPLEEIAAVVDSFCAYAEQQRASQERAKAAKYPGLCHLIQQWDNIEAVPSPDGKTTFLRLRSTSGTTRPRDEPEGDGRPNKKMSLGFLNNSN